MTEQGQRFWNVKCDSCGFHWNQAHDKVVNNLVTLHNQANLGHTATAHPVWKAPDD